MSCLSNVGFAEVNAIRLGWRVVVTSGQVRFDEIFEVWITWVVEGGDQTPHPPPLIRCASELLTRFLRCGLLGLWRRGDQTPHPPPLIRCARLSAAFESCRAHRTSEANELL